MLNFSSDAGERIAGKVDPSLTEEQLIEFDRLYFKQRCTATIVRTTFAFKNGRQRASNHLAKLESLTALTIYWEFVEKLTLLGMCQVLI